jgi:hypothetical protein
LRKKGINTVAIAGAEASSGALVVLLGCKKRIISRETQIKIHAINVTRNIRILNNELETALFRDIKQNRNQIPNMSDDNLLSLIKKSLKSVPSNPIETQEELETILGEETLLPQTEIYRIMEQKRITSINPNVAKEFGIAHAVYE